MLTLSSPTMGRHSENLDLEQRVLARVGKGYQGLRVLDMGAIEHKTPEPRMPARQWFTEHGAKYESIDLNGKWGAIKHDLDTPIPDDLRERFHLVLNYGTSEHVNDQYMFFKNMHDACRPGGIMIHHLNHIGFAEGHGRYYYTQRTVFALARLASYSILSMDHFASGAKTERSGFILAAFQKRSQSRFPGKLMFRLRSAIIDTGDVRRTGDYNLAGHGKIEKKGTEG